MQVTINVVQVTLVHHQVQLDLIKLLVKRANILQMDQLHNLVRLQEMDIQPKKVKPLRESALKDSIVKILYLNNLFHALKERLEEIQD